MQIYVEENLQDNLQRSVEDTNDQSELLSEKPTTEQYIENVIKSPSQSKGENTITKRKIFVSPKKNPKRKMVTEDRRLIKAYDIIDSISSEPASSRDECSVYGEHVANKLRKFNERNKAVLIHKINNLIFEAEMEVFNEVSYQDTPLNTRYQNVYSSSSASSIVGTPQASPQSPTTQTVSIYNMDQPSSQYDIAQTAQSFVSNFNVQKDF